MEGGEGLEHKTNIISVPKASKATNNLFVFFSSILGEQHKRNTRFPQQSDAGSHDMTWVSEIEGIFPKVGTFNGS